MYGIKITKPWNNEMYNHNDKVADVMKIELENALDVIIESGNEDNLRDISKAICYCGFGSGFDFDDIAEQTKDELDKLQNYQLAEDLPWFVKKGFINNPQYGFVGYGK